MRILLNLSLIEVKAQSVLHFRFLQAVEGFPILFSPVQQVHTLVALIFVSLWAPAARAHHTVRIKLEGSADP